MVEIGLAVFVGDPKRCMGCVGGDIRKKRRVALFFDPVHGFVKPHICAISFKSFNRTIVSIVVIKIIISKIICSRCNAPGGMVNRFLKSPILWAVGIIVAEVPFAKMSCAVAIHGENIRQSRQFGIHQRPSHAYKCGAISECVLACQQFAARWRTHGRDVKIRKPDALVV